MKSYRCDDFEIRDFGRFCSVRDLGGNRAWTITGHQHTLLSLLLAARARDPDGHVSRDQIADAFWGGARIPNNFLQVIDNSVFRLRQSLDESLIKTIRGHGYAFAGELHAANGERDRSSDAAPAEEDDAALRLWDHYYRVTSCAVADLHHVMRINRDTFGPENCWTDDNIRKIHQRSPRSHLLLRDARGDDAIGFASVFALHSEVMDRVARQQLPEMNLEPADFVDIEDADHNHRLYIAVVALSGRFRSQSRGVPLAVPLAARQLIVGVTELLLATGLAAWPRVELLTVAWTAQGERLADRMGLRPQGVSAGHPLYRGDFERDEAQRFVIDGKRLDRELALGRGSPSRA